VDDFVAFTNTSIDKGVGYPVCRFVELLPGDFFSYLFAGF